MKGFEKCRISSAVDGTGGDMTCCGMAVKRMGMLGVSVCEEDEGTVNLETVTLIDTGG